MSVSIEYSFTFDDLNPSIKKSVLVDGEKVDETVVDISKDYAQIPTETLKDFCNFLVEKFNYLVSTIVSSGLNQYKFNETVENLRWLCVVKTGCEDEIYSRENPTTGPVNPFANQG